MSVWDTVKVCVFAAAVTLGALGLWLWMNGAF